AGRRFSPETLPKNSWHVRDFVWAPRLGCTGLQRIHVLKDCVILGGAGVGGGSLNYANTLYEPPQPFYDDPQWSHITDWQAELAPHYAQAKRMLGVVTNPTTTPSDIEMQRLAEQFGKADTYHPTPVGVFFGRGEALEPGQTVADPFFGGAGPERTGFIQWGECMTGCRNGAKNTLVTNYLYLAESNGAEIHPLTTVTDVRPRAAGGYEVVTVRTGRWFAKADRTFTADQVVFAAGTYNTQRLLHRLRETSLPNISPRLGYLTRTNSEALLGVRVAKPKRDYTQGVAITSSWHPDENTHIEPVRYGKGSNAMGLLTTLMTAGGTRRNRWWQFLLAMLRNPFTLRLLVPRKWSERVIILLVMQTLDNSITVLRKRTRFGFRRLTSEQGAGDPNPTWIPVANQAADQLADNVDGIAGGTWGDLMNIPMTAHFLGGCVIGDSPETGVVDPYHRLYGHPGLHVVDGSTLSANLGVNPSLSITAQAERAMSLWPNRGEQDTRPQLGDSYIPLAPITPSSPAVPEGASGALRYGTVRLGMPSGGSGSHTARPGGFAPITTDTGNCR
ncbi:MAG: GMC family oxidoreductase, partial [Actinobacteria bacterium]|nr:GMC family oxidoreductase [Actinomycetota bacterium]